MSDAREIPPTRHTELYGARSVMAMFCFIHDDHAAKVLEAFSSPPHPFMLHMTDH